MLQNIAEMFMKGMLKSILVYYNLGEILNRLKSKGFFCIWFVFIFFTLYNTLPHY